MWRELRAHIIERRGLRGESGATVASVCGRSECRVAVVPCRRWGACNRDDADMNKALATLEQGVRAACGDGDFGGLTLEGIVGRWRYACRSEADSLAWRSFG